MEYSIKDILQSKRNVFITGAAGTGKSYMLKEMIKEMDGNTFITAPTGVAALQIGGVTFHKVCGMGYCVGNVQQLHTHILRSKKLKKQWLSMKNLIIDEISMIDISLFVRMAKVIGLLHFEEGIANRIKPFGSIRLFLVGDFLQLPSIQQYSEKEGEETRTYTYLFQHPIWQELDLQTIYLTRPMRYIGNEKSMEFASILSDIRLGNMTEQVIKMMEKCSIKPESHIIDEEKGLEITPTILIATNKEVDEFNNKKLAKLEGEEFIFNSTYECTPKCTISKEDLIKQSLVPDPLVLKIGAQVMLLKNHLDRGLCNGSRGVVTGFTDGNLPIVSFLDGQSMIVEYHTVTMTQNRQNENEEEIKDRASLRYIPLRLAYAITIHKSQGLSCDSVYLALETCFAPGQLYVALSRCRNMDNMYIKSWSKDVFRRCRPSKEVLSFYETLTC